MKELSNKSFIKGFKFRCYPTEDQKVLLEKTFGCSRWVWNKALAEITEEYERFKITNDLKDRPDLSEFGLIRRLGKYKTNVEFSWLYEVSHVSLQYSMKYLSNAFTSFFRKGTKYPNFKRKSQKQSITLLGSTGSFRFKENKVYITHSKEPLTINFHRILPSAPKNCTISKTSSEKYFISFTCEYNPVPTNGKGIIGIDLGLKDFIATSDGLKVSNPKHLAKHEKNLKRKQQTLARCKLGSKNRIKAKQKVAITHERVANQRNDFLHKVSRSLVNENQVIGVETLKVKNMVKNRRLSKAISDVGWGMFIQYLTYKAVESNHCNVIKIDGFYPSTHICNNCQAKLSYKLKLRNRGWTCPQCGIIHDRDINAAKNIKDEAIKLIKQQFNVDLAA